MPDIQKAQQLAAALNNTVAANYPDGVNVHELVMAAGSLLASYISAVPDAEKRNDLLRIAVTAMRRTVGKTANLKIVTSH